MIYAKGKDIEITEKELNDHAARLINAGGREREESYWEYIREIKRETAICSKYINDKEKEYREAHENEELISYGEDGSVHDAWEEEKEKLIQQLVMEQQVEIIKEEK